MFITIGTKVFDNNKNVYSVDEILGNGGFGNVYRARRMCDGKTFAIKTLQYEFPSKASVDSFQNEIRLALLPRSEHIIRYEYVHDGSEFSEFPPFIIMEYADNGTLHDLIDNQRKSGEQFDMQSLVNMFSQLIKGMDSLSEVLVHRDIKPANILLCGNVLKISDFGLSKLSGESTRTLSFKGFGTAKYVAPEAWNNDSNTIQMDIYSMGIVFYELATLGYPYVIKDNAKTIDYQNAHLYQGVINPVRINTRLPAHLASMIIRMLEKPVQRRFNNWSQIISAFDINVQMYAKIGSYVENALSKRNETDIQLQSKKAEEERQRREREDYCLRIQSQIEIDIIEPIKDFVDSFNLHYASPTKILLEKKKYIVGDSNYSIYITTPSNKITMNFEFVFIENFLKETQTDSFHRREEKKIINYIPQCRNRDVLAWARVYVTSGEGFNLLLQKSNGIYGEWFIVVNRNSGLSRTHRIEPFGFTIGELRKEINYIDATHIYSSKVESLKAEHLLEFISQYV